MTPPDLDRWAHRLAETTLLSKPALGPTRLVSVDGPAGSGKTTLATALSSRLLAEHVSVVVVHLDDLYDGWTGLNDELETRVTRQLLKPLAQSRPARWLRYDWHTGRFDGWQTLRAPEVLILDGCGSGARTYAAYISLLVWVEAKPAERVRRGVGRDGEQVLPNWLAWMESEATHFAANDTAARADVTIMTG